MGKLYYFWGTMSSAKSANLLMKAHQFRETGCSVLLAKPIADRRFVSNEISSRVGLSEPCILLEDHENLYDRLFSICKENGHTHIFIDEVQMLDKEQIKQLWSLTRNKEIPVNVFCFGLKVDYKNNIFPPCSTLLTLRDKEVELVSKCNYCNNKASTHLRIVDNTVIREGESIILGDIKGEERYKSVCQECYHNPPKDL